MSAKATVSKAYSLMKAFKAKNGATMSREALLEALKDEPALALQKEDGTPYEYNKKPATRVQRFKQALSSVRSQFASGSKANPKWVAACDAIASATGIAVGASDVSLDIEADASAEDIAAAI